MIVFSSCSKSNDKQQDSESKIRVQEFGSYFSKFKLSYNNQDQLVQAEHWITDGYTPTLRPYMLIEYNYVDGKAVGYNHYSYKSPSGEKELERAVTFNFDSKGHLLQSVAKNMDTMFWETNAEGKITGSRSRNRPSENWEYRDGNVFYPDRTTDYGNSTQVFKVALTYNNKRNPLSNNNAGEMLYIAFTYIAGGAYELFSANFATKLANESKTTFFSPSGNHTDTSKATMDYTYQYDETGLLKQMQYTVKKEDYISGQPPKFSEKSYENLFVCFRRN